ncbi:hypothetical protein HMPREF9193_00307 [Treponema lecithinolyticum ATCC 700332]|uniref:Uncharacterized protein n=1 Tax=Treponema lecithinolyticum ATCC 700332 TaxID=1321815 RepID=A0ABN0P1K8_TRELE|nr:hypothetical protein HMPREF9193_00307 [Treponema lecithinolyticum ATCC 700332]
MSNRAVVVKPGSIVPDCRSYGTAATALYERLSIPPLTRYIIEDWK